MPVAVDDEIPVCVGYRERGENPRDRQCENTRDDSVGSHGVPPSKKRYHEEREGVSDGNRHRSEQEYGGAREGRDGDEESEFYD